MEITGRIIAACEVKGGISQRTGNAWKSQEFVLETQEQYPKKCVFNVFGEDKLNAFNIQIGETLKVQIDIDAREYNGRWFNSITAWKVERPQAQAQAPAPQQPAYQQPTPQPAYQPAATTNDKDDLPF